MHVDPVFSPPHAAATLSSVFTNTWVCSCSCIDSCLPNAHAADPFRSKNQCGFNLGHRVSLSGREGNCHLPERATNAVVTSNVGAQTIKKTKNAATAEAAETAQTPTRLNSVCLRWHSAHEKCSCAVCFLNPGIRPRSLQLVDILLIQLEDLHSSPAKHMKHFPWCCSQLFQNRKMCFCFFRKNKWIKVEPLIKSSCHRIEITLNVHVYICSHSCFSFTKSRQRSQLSQ